MNEDMQEQCDLARTAVRQSIRCGLTRTQFVKLVLIAWDLHDLRTADHDASVEGCGGDAVLDRMVP